MKTSADRRDDARLSSPVTGTELADRLQSGLSLEEALGERAVGSVSAPLVSEGAPSGPRRSWIFAGLLAVSLMGWPLAFYQGKVAETAEAERSAQEKVALKEESLRIAEQAHAALVQQQNDVLDRKQADLIELIGHCSEQFAATAKHMERARNEGRWDDVVAHFMAFCAIASEDSELFTEQMEQFTIEVRDIIDGVADPKTPRD